MKQFCIFLSIVFLTSGILSCATKRKTKEVEKLEVETDNVVKNDSSVNLQLQKSNYDYLQNYSNTYLPLATLEKYLLEACDEDVVRIALATRPDCVSDSYLEKLADIKSKTKVDISVELGLQTVNYHALEEIRRGHSLAEYLDAMQRINKYGLESRTHVI